MQARPGGRVVTHPHEAEAVSGLCVGGDVLGGVPLATGDPVGDPVGDRVGDPVGDPVGVDVVGELEKVGPEVAGEPVGVELAGDPVGGCVAGEPLGLDDGDALGPPEFTPCTGEAVEGLPEGDPVDGYPVGLPVEGDMDGLPVGVDELGLPLGLADGMLVVGDPDGEPDGDPVGVAATSQLSSCYVKRKLCARCGCLKYAHTPNPFAGVGGQKGL